MMKRKHIGLLVVMMLLVSCEGKEGSKGPAGKQGTPGPTLPSVTWVSPAPGSIDVPIDSVIRASFTKTMDASTLDSSTFRVSAGGVQITGTISYNSGSQTVYFSPNVPLSAFAYFSVVLTTGVKATEGTALAQDYSWSFTTGGSFAPASLYAASWGLNAIEVYNNVGAASGNIMPARTITGLNGPLTPWLDKASDRLYVANFSGNNVLVFNNASTINGAVAPSRTITSVSIDGPFRLWLDSASDRLYVVNQSGNSIAVFNNASTASGATVPDRTISGPGTYLTSPSAIWLDSASDRLYVANYGGSSQIVVFNNASTAIGNVAPSRTIAGPATTLNCSYGIWLDGASDSLYVANTYAGNILVFNNASTANGNIAPARTISGVSIPAALWLVSATDRLYVDSASQNSILVFNNASTANGSVAPSRSFSASSPWGIWLDTDQ